MFEDSILGLLKVLINARIKLCDIDASARIVNIDRALPWSCNADFIAARIDNFVTLIGCAINEIDTFISEFPAEYTETLKLMYTELLELIKKEKKHEH